MRVMLPPPQDVLGCPVDTSFVLWVAMDCDWTTGNVSPFTDPALTHILPFPWFSFIVLLDIQKKKEEEECVKHLFIYLQLISLKGGVGVCIAAATQSIYSGPCTPCSSSTLPSTEEQTPTFSFLLLQYNWIHLNLVFFWKACIQLRSLLSLYHVPGTMLSANESLVKKKRKKRL